MFFQDPRGRLWPLSAIKRISEPREITESGEKLSVRLVDLGEHEIMVHESVVRDIVRQSSPLMQAGQGCYIVHAEDGQIYRYPVIGWCLSAEEGILPITMDGINADLDISNYVLFPNGDVHHFHSGPMSVEEFVSKSKIREDKKDG